MAGINLLNAFSRSSGGYSSKMTPTNVAYEVAYELRSQTRRGLLQESKADPSSYVSVISSKLQELQGKADTILQYQGNGNSNPYAAGSAEAIDFQRKYDDAHATFTSKGYNPNDFAGLSSREISGIASKVAPEVSGGIQYWKRGMLLAAGALAFDQAVLGGTGLNFAKSAIGIDGNILPTGLTDGIGSVFKPIADATYGAAVNKLDEYMAYDDARSIVALGSFLSVLGLGTLGNNRLGAPAGIGMTLAAGALAWQMASSTELDRPFGEEGVTTDYIQLAEKWIPGFD